MGKKKCLSTRKISVIKVTLSVNICRLLWKILWHWAGFCSYPPLVCSEMAGGALATLRVQQWGRIQSVALTEALTKQKA